MTQPPDPMMVTEEMIEAGRVAYFHFRHTIESDVLFRDLTEEEQEGLVLRVVTAALAKQAQAAQQLPPPMVLVEALRTGRAILKTGDYDGADLMRAWCAMADAADYIERAALAQVTELQKRGGEA